MTTRTGILAAVITIGLATLSASAAPFLIFDIRIDSATGGATIMNNKFAEVNKGSSGTITMSLIAWIWNNNTNVNDEGFKLAQYGMTTPGTMRGNLSGSVESDFRATGWAAGNNNDLDSDGDLDIGALSGASTGYQIAASGTTANMVEEFYDSNLYGYGKYYGFKLSTVTFTYDTAAFPSSTNISLALRTAISSSYAFTKDGVAYNWKGNNTGINVIAGPTFTAVDIPEPATMALLGLGGLALAIRRRRSC